MEITKYGITLVSLTEEHLEMVRQWRNSTEVSQFMQFKEEITPEMQREWFESISTIHNEYGIILLEGKPIGLTNMKNIDYTTMSAEGGIFIADTDYWGTDVPIRVALCGFDWCFEEKGLLCIYATVSQNNHAAIRYNSAFGYELLSEQEEGEFQKYLLTKKNYYQHRTKLFDLLWN